MVVTVTNLIVPRDLPDDLRARLELYLQADMLVEAETVYDMLLDDSPGSIPLIYGHINNHFAIPDEDGSPSPRDDRSLVERYERLSQNPEFANAGYYGLGLIAANLGDYETSLRLYQQVTNPNQRYLNNSIGYAYASLGQSALAEDYFRREVVLRGNIVGAVHNLSQLYLDEERYDDLNVLVHDPQSGPFVDNGTRRLLAIHLRDLGEYLRLAFIVPLEQIEFAAAFSAIAIAVMYFIYFWRIDIFEQEPVTIAWIALAFGAFSAPFSFLFSDGLAYLYPLGLGETWLNDLVYSVIYIGVVEEVAKFIMVIAVIVLFRQANEPLDLMIYGGLVALGFASLENALYFTSYGLSIVFARAMISTVMHMAMTGTVCFFWARAKYIDRKNVPLAVVQGLIVAAVLHGLFDYFILSEFVQIGILSLVIMMLTATAYGRMINNALNFSPYFDQLRAGSARLENYAYLMTLAVVALLIVYLYNHNNFSTEIATDNLLNLGLDIVLTALVVFGSLGQFNVVHRQRISLYGEKAKS